MVPQMRKRRLALEMGRNHLRFDGPFMTVRGSAFNILIFIVVATIEVVRTFMLVGTTVILISRDQVSHVVRGVLVEFLVTAEDEYGDIDRTEHGELVRLLEQAAFSLQECD